MKFMLMKQGFIPSLDNINFIRYSDDSSHFSFELPDNWTRVSKNDSTSNIVCIALEKITSVEDYCKVSVTAGFETHFSEKYGAKTPEEILAFWKSSGTENAKDYARYELISTKMKKYQGHESVLNEILVQIDKNSQLLCFQEFILPFDDAVLYILFQSPFEDSPYFKKIYENSIRSLKFTPPSMSN